MNIPKLGDVVLLVRLPPLLVVAADDVMVRVRVSEVEVVDDVDAALLDGVGDRVSGVADDVRTPLIRRGVRWGGGGTQATAGFKEAA